MPRSFRAAFFLHFHVLIRFVLSLVINGYNYYESLTLTTNYDTILKLITLLCIFEPHIALL